MKLTRRAALSLTAAPLFAAPAKFKVGVTDWNLRLQTKLEALDLAKRVGFAGVEVSIGRRPIDGKLPLDNPDLIAQYRKHSQATGVATPSTCLDILHVDYLKESPQAPKWVADGIRLTRAIGAKNMLLPFFGKGQIRQPEEMNRVADVLRELGPEAAKAGVVLALENTNSAEENLRILERAKSPAVRVFYDVGNSYGQGYDIYAELKRLGTEFICQVHLKDNPHYLGEGQIRFPEVLSILREMGYSGYADLETSAPSGGIEADMARNFQFVKKLLAA
jgi:sugar phosphate isomerase/epimerase